MNHPPPFYPNGRKPRVLVIDADTPVRGLLADILSDAGYKVLPSDHLVEPECVQKLRPDLIVLDLVVDGITAGWNYVRQLRAAGGTANIPAVICTDNGKLVRQVTMKQFPVSSGLVLKPFEIDDLLSVVSDALIGSTEPSPDAVSSVMVSQQGDLSGKRSATSQMEGPA